MEDYLFTVEPPLVSTNEELEKIISMYQKYDSWFIASGCIKERRERFEKLWQNFKPYADNHFLTEIKTNFHQRSWEMYIGNVLLVKKLSIKSKNEGPDFIVSDNVYIECVACTKGDPNKPDSVPEMYIAPTPNKIRDQVVPIDKMILRITQAIKDKAINQYKKWENKKWFKKQASFIIAINTGDLEYPQDCFGIPLIINALFGLNSMRFNRKGDTSFSWRENIKKGDSEVQVNYFANGDFDFISGILFSDKTVLNHPENIGDDCIFVNNPFSKYPVNEDFVKLFKNWNTEKRSNGITLQKNYK